MENEILKNKYIFNPCYILRNDINRVILTDSGKNKYEELGKTNQIFNTEKINKSIDNLKQFENVRIVELTAPVASNYKSNGEFFYKYRQEYLLN